MPTLVLVSACRIHISPPPSGSTPPVGACRRQIHREIQVLLSHHREPTDVKPLSLYM